MSNVSDSGFWEAHYLSEQTGWEKGRCVAKGAKKPAPSGAFGRCATASGVFDLNGNVAEWTASPVREGAPQMVIRGGSFAQADAKLACDARDYLLPGQGGAAHLGFRCCRTTAP